MESRRILVFGLPDGTSKPQLIKHFQSKRVSGRGDVESIDLADSGQAVITFSDAEAATRVLQQGYRQRFQNCLLRVALLPEQASTPNQEDNLDDDSMESDESSTDSDEDEHDRRHEWSDNPFMVQNDKRRNAEASATAAAMKEATTAKTTQRNTAPSEQCTVKVTGLPEGASEDLVWNYFEIARRSKGGTISSVIMKPEIRTCLVTFESGDDAKRTVEHPSHTLDGVRVEVSLQDDSEDEPGTLDSIDETTFTIIVHDISPRSTEDAVINYFENYRRSGGGEICAIEYSEGAALITFAEVKDAQRLLERSHSIDGKDVTVVKQPPKKKVPPDPLRVLVKGLNDRTTEDCLRFYLEKFCDVDVVKVYFGSESNALATFASEPDFSRLFDGISKDTKGLEGAIPCLDRVPVCSCILVTGLKEGTSDDTIQLYFENTRRSGGYEVSRVERQGKNQALVYFEDPSSVENVIRKHHVLEQVEVSVRPYFHFLEESVPDPVRNQTEIKYDPDVIAYIQTSHSTELQTLLEEKYANLSADSENSTVTISSSDNEGCNEQWQERSETLKQFLNTFTKVKLDLVSEPFDEIKQRWQCPQNSTERQGDALVSFDVVNRFVQIIGKTEYVEEVTQELRELIRAAEEDTELKKSIIQLVEDGIPRARLTLLQMSGFCERLQNEHQHLSISVDLENEKLCLEGPRKLLQDVIVEAFKFTTKIAEKIMKLPIEVVEVLKISSVNTFFQELLEQNGIQAIVLCDQTMRPNEVQIVGVNLDSTTKAEKLVQDNVQERSLHLAPENIQALESRRWKVVKTTLTSKFKVGITLPTSSSTVWVRGINKDVKECLDEIAQFLDVNTILKRIVPLEQGSMRFLFQVWESKLDDIKNKLSSCSVDMREAPTGDGIEVCGTAEGLEKCLPRIHELIKTVSRDSVAVRDKPRIEKFLSQEKGRKLLKAIEDDHRCIIVTSETPADDTSAVTAETSEDLVELSDTSDTEMVLFIFAGCVKHLQEAVKEVKGICANEILQVDEKETETSREKVKEFEAYKNVEEAGDVDVTPGATLKTNRLEMSIGKVKVSVLKGDITSERVDVIVNSTNSDLRHAGGVSKAIVDNGGSSIQDESDKIIKKMGQPLRDGEAVATGAGNLPCKMVVHAIGSIWSKFGASKNRNILRRACLNSFYVAQDHKMTSVALPAIGSGIYGMPKDVCAEVMFDAAEEFVRLGEPKTKTITDIRFVNIDDPTAQAFRNEFMKRYAANQDDRPVARNEGTREEEEREDEGMDRTTSAGNPDIPQKRKTRGKYRDTSGGSTQAGALMLSGQHDTYSGSHGNASVTQVLNEPSSSSTKSYRDAPKENDGSSKKKNEIRRGHYSSPEYDEKDKSKADSAYVRAISAPECPICLDVMENQRTLKCGHAFCLECLRKALKVNNMCPVCKVPQGVVIGTQPPGEMNVRCDRHLNVPGFKGSGTIVIDYHFPPGTQGPEHPNPGQRYEGTRRTGYLPNTTEGNEVLQLLKRAFDARLVFTIGTSITTGRSNQVTWNDIHHKTSLSGGPQQFGYPDPNYLRRVKEDLAAKGIR